MNPRRRIVVVGGGPGGLCAAMLLQARGFDVTVLEKRDGVGGQGSGLHTIRESARIATPLLCERGGVGFFGSRPLPRGG